MTPTRRAALEADEPQPGEGPWRVHGVLLGDGEVTSGKHSQKHWPGDAQKAAVDSLIGADFGTEHEDDFSACGYVEQADFIPGTGTVYSAVLESYSTAKALSDGRLSPSLEASVPDADAIEYTDDGVPAMTDYQYERVGCVPSPASASASAEAGPLDNSATAAALADGQDVNSFVRAALGTDGKNAERERKLNAAREQYGVDI